MPDRRKRGLAKALSDLQMLFKRAGYPEASAVSGWSSPNALAREQDGSLIAGAGSRARVAVATLGYLLALHITLGDIGDQATVVHLASNAQDASGDNVRCMSIKATPVTQPQMPPRDCHRAARRQVARPAGPFCPAAPGLKWWNDHAWPHASAD